MSGLDETQVRRYRRQSALKSFEIQLQSTTEITNDDHLIKFYERVVRTIGSDTPIRFLEFGVYDGTSLRKIVRNFTNSRSEFIGFDSFEGLPENWHGFARGKFSTEGKVPLSSDKRVRFVKGWFQNTLPPYLAELRAGPSKQPVQHLVHYDADLYSSTLFVLGCLWFDIPEYYFIFDEFALDEVVALQDFTSAFPARIEFFARTERPLQVFGKLTRTEFALS